jgi:hypothetical protein
MGENEEQRTLRTASRHDQRRVVATEFRHTNLSDLVTNARESSRNHRLERLLDVGSRLVLKLARRGLFNERLRLLVGDADEVVLLRAESIAWRDIADTDRESLVGYPRTKSGLSKGDLPRQRRASEDSLNHLAQSFAILFIADAASSAP